MGTSIYIYKLLILATIHSLVHATVNNYVAYRQVSEGLWRISVAVTLSYSVALSDGLKNTADIANQVMENTINYAGIFDGSWENPVAYYGYSDFMTVILKFDWYTGSTMADACTSVATYWGIAQTYSDFEPTNSGGLRLRGDIDQYQFSTIRAYGLTANETDWDELYQLSKFNTTAYPPKVKHQKRESTCPSLGIRNAKIDKHVFATSYDTSCYVWG